MCWSPKVKTPKLDTDQIRASEPAPLTEAPKGVLFGGEGEDNTVDNAGEATPGSGKSSLKVKRNEPVRTSTKSQSAIRSKAFGK